MAAAANYVNYEVSFMGDHRLGESDHTVIEIGFRGVEQEIYAIVDHTFESAREQLLTIHTRISSDEESDESWMIQVPIEIAQPLSLRIKDGNTIPLKEIPEIEQNETYRIRVMNEEGELFARIKKVESAASEAMRRSTTTDAATREAVRTDFLERTQKMGQALMLEGMRNYALAADGGGGVFGNNPTAADIFAHGIRGVICAGQEMHPGIQVPYTTPSVTFANLDALSVDALQARFKQVFIQDKQYEQQRMQAALQGDVNTLNRILKEESANSQLLIHLAEALEQKGVTPRIPQSAAFQSATQQSAEAHRQGLEAIREQCKQQ